MLESAWAEEHIFSGTSTGIHALGSARPYVGTDSQVSSVNDSGRLMYATDSERLYYLDNSSTTEIGYAPHRSVLTCSTTTGFPGPAGSLTEIHFTSANPDFGGMSGITVPSTFTTSVLTIPSTGLYMVNPEFYTERGTADGRLWLYHNATAYHHWNAFTDGGNPIGISNSISPVFIECSSGDTISLLIGPRASVSTCTVHFSAESMSRLVVARIA